MKKRWILELAAICLIAGGVVGSALQRNSEHVRERSTIKNTPTVVIMRTPTAVVTTTAKVAVPTRVPLPKSAHIPPTPVTQVQVIDLKVGQTGYTDISGLVMEKDGSVYLDSTDTCDISLTPDEVSIIPSLISVTKTKKGFVVALFDQSIQQDNGSRTLLPIYRLQVNPMPPN